MDIVQIVSTEQPVAAEPLCATAEELLGMDLVELYLWGAFLLQYGLVFLTGPSDCGKSRLLRQLAIAIVLRLSEFLGFILHVRHGRVYYISGEDTAVGVKSQLEREVAGLYPPEALKNLIFLFEVEQLIPTLDTLLTAAPADMIVLDPWSDIYEGNSNDFVSVRRHFKKLKGLSEKHKCVIVAIHHNIKHSERFAPNKAFMNGSQAIEASPRIVLELRNGEAANERLLTILKHNYIPRELKENSLVLELQGERLLFKYTGESIGINLSKKGKGKFVEEEAFWVSEMMKRKEQGLSYDDAWLELSLIYGNSNLPSRTWFVNHCKGQEGHNTRDGPKATK